MFAVHTAVRVEQFLKKFDYCKIDCQHYERTELIEYLITNSEGEYKRLFEVILRQLAVCCRKVNCVVASNFKFEIRKKDYLRIC